MIKNWGAVILMFFLLNLISCKEKEPGRPNIVIIMADDIGFSDIGCYGGEIKTPNIDMLANEGLRFKTFYNMAKCNPTRSSLLTGLYTGGNGAVHLAHLTKQAGYVNVMSGKEHFDDWVPQYCRSENVFDHSFYFWATTEYFEPPSGEFQRPFYLNGQKLATGQIAYQKSPMYKTDFITDYALNWLDEVLDEKKPFFLYLPYHAAHYPLQARQEDIKKYRGTYKKGWDTLRQERFERMKKKGVLLNETELSPAEDNLNRLRGPFLKEYTDYHPWESMPGEQQDSLDLEMAVYAAMIDRLDQNIGRVLRRLDQGGELDNTLVIFLSDNGACPFYANKIKDVPPGPANSYWSLRTSWANLSNTPFRQYKQAGHEGGSHTPFVAYWPGKIKPNTITGQPGHVVDIVPTVLDILKVEYPKTIEGYPSLKPHGKSLLPIFVGEERQEPGFFMSGLDKFRMFRQGDYKIVKMNGENWELYNMKNDPSELKDLADKFPGKVEEMVVNYEKVLQEQAMNNENVKTK